jgi:hypothetical protein
MDDSVATLSRRLDRLTLLARSLQDEKDESDDVREVVEVLMREIATLRKKLKVLNLP